MQLEESIFNKVSIFVVFFQLKNGNIYHHSKNKNEFSRNPFNSSCLGKRLSLSENNQIKWKNEPYFLFIADLTRTHYYYMEPFDLNTIHASWPYTTTYSEGEKEAKIPYIVVIKAAIATFDASFGINISPLRAQNNFTDSLVWQLQTHLIWDEYSKTPHASSMYVNCWASDHLATYCKCPKIVKVLVCRNPQKRTLRPAPAHYKLASKIWFNFAIRILP